MRNYLFTIYMIGLTALLSGLVGCSLQHHLEKRDHHTEKAIEKGAQFKKEIEYVYEIKTKDSLIYIDGEELLIEVPVIDSFPYEVERISYVPMSRQERLHLRDSMKYAHKELKIDLKRFKVLADMYQDSLKHERKINRQENKTERTQIRQENKGSGWLIWLIIGMALGVIFTLLVLKRSARAKRLLSSYFNSERS